MVDLEGVLEPVIKSMSTKARERNVELRTCMDCHLPRSLHCDGRRLQQILYNLIGSKYIGMHQLSCFPIYSDPTHPFLVIAQHNRRYQIQQPWRMR